MKKSGNKMIKFLAAMSSLIFSGLVLSVSCLAWFTSTRMQENGANNFQVSNVNDLRVSSYTFYGWDEDQKTGRELVNVGEKDGDSYLEQYDMFITDRNANNNRILKIDVEFIKSRNEEKTLKVVVNGNNKPLWANEGKTTITNNISNIIGFKGVVAEYTTTDGTSSNPSFVLDKTDAASIFSSAKAAFANIPSALTFVTLQDPATNSTKSNSIDLVETSFVVPTNALSASFFIEYNYSSSLIESFEPYMLDDDGQAVASKGATDVLQGETITFAADIPHMVVGFDE